MKKNDGFTLIEVIISVAIIGILSMSFMSVFNTSIVNIVRAGNRTIGVDLAEAEMLENGVVIGESVEIEVILTDGIKQKITGSTRKGTINVNKGMLGQVEVSIETFVPN